MVGAARLASAYGAMEYESRAHRIEEVRATAARLIGVPTADVAFVKNTTEGVALVATGLDWLPGDRVVVPDLEFPTVLLPFLALEDRGVEVTRVQPEGGGRTLPLAAFRRAMESGRPPRVVATSWVQYGRGWRTDMAALGELCRDAGSLLVVDAIQGLGAVPADVSAWGADVVVASAHKWLLGPEGIGVLAVSESARTQVRPAHAGWASVAHRGDFADLRLVFDDSARRYEGGTLDVAGIHALGASLDLLDAAGIDAIWTHVCERTDQAVIGLAALGAEVCSDRSDAGRSGIVTFRLPGGSPIDQVAVLASHGIATAARGDGIRIAPHGYTTADEIDHLVGAVGQHLT